MYKLAAIGQRDKIIFLKALGIEIFSVRETGEAEKVFEDIKKIGKFGIVFIDSQYLKEIKEKTKKLKEDLPVVLALPLDFRKEKADDELRDIIKRAIGTEEITIK